MMVNHGVLRQLLPRRFPAAPFLGAVDEAPLLDEVAADSGASPARFPDLQPSQRLYSDRLLIF